jgi:protein required for attachment to host cells
MRPYTPTWIVLMDGSRGRILVQEQPGAALARAFGDGFTSSRALSHEVGEDRPGRNRGSAGATARHALDPRTNPHDKAEHEFCAEMAKFVDRGVQAGRVERLILVAPPHALGDLRQTLSPQAIERVQTEVARDWLDLADTDIEARLGDALRSPLATPPLN